ncbi:hypothetical protein SAMN04487765_3730 [Tenacibaculum sp. MAR_2010_89]|uniref:hypothetical protein n=1 Tax=Tenacibaculum sp. MAR_2010_89 TaxID=1250198 RepID=UPI000896F0CF|nr:hypothetical protein [Tenacibaculum sp. MAR_2010_89]SEE67298.1 hypothetical protein SAMN04487765_3730 [Tenacibaculum sp. MAR_2010_89]
MEYLTIDNRMAVKGNLKLIKESFFDLEINSFVTQIGDGRETGNYRTDTFSQPFKYVGCFLEKDLKYYAFQVPKKMLPGKSQKHYLLYETTGYEILSRHKSYVRFYSAQFKTTQLELF